MTEHVYFARSGDAIKIGYSVDVPRRIVALATGSPEPITLIGIAEGDQRLEQALHRLLERYRVRNEWFRDCAEVRRILSDMGVLFPAVVPELKTSDDAEIAADEAFSALFVVARRIWPTHTATHLALRAGCSERTAYRYLQGQRQPTGTFLVALLQCECGADFIAAIKATARTDTRDGEVR